MHELIELVGPARPELLPVVRYAIERILRDGGRVLEFGSGHSTVWFAELGAEVVSVEHDRVWEEAVCRWLAERGLAVKLWLCKAKHAALIADKYEDGWFDLVLIDNYQYSRYACLKAARAKVRPGGWLILDDAQWPDFVDVPKLLRDWERYDVLGMHHRTSGITALVRTDFYQRPGGDECS